MTGARLQPKILIRTINMNGIGFDFFQPSEKSEFIGTTLILNEQSDEKISSNKILNNFLLNTIDNFL